MVCVSPLLQTGKAVFVSTESKFVFETVTLSDEHNNELDTLKKARSCYTYRTL